MRILGIDPGVARTGWAIIEEKDGEISAIAYDCFITSKDDEASKRLHQIYNQIKFVIKTHSPDILVIEQLFFNTNVKTAFAVSQARGVMLLAAEQKKLPNFFYTPLQVKVAITGYGRAEKVEVGKEIKKILKLKHVPKLDDTADALAVAVAHIYANGKGNGVSKKK